MKGLIFAASLMLASPVTAADQFDLVCKGSQTMLGEQPKPYAFELRVDLAVKKYCQDECRGVFAIQEYDDRSILFDKAPPDDLDYSMKIEIVNRETGAYSSSLYHRDKSGGVAIDAMCDPAPFKGFPRPPTRF